MQVAMAGKTGVDRQSKQRLLQLLEQSIRKNAPKEEFGLLFSGGVDSVLLALLFKRMKLSFKCFFGYVEGLGEPKDLVAAKDAAKKLKLGLETASIKFKQVPGLLSQVVPAINTTSPVQVGVALPIELACRKASKQGIKTVFSGMGADELFAGYAKFRNSKNVAEQSLQLLEQLPAHDLRRDKAIAEKNGLALKVPFLDPELAQFALALKKEFKLSKKENKLILRELALDLGLPSKIAERKKLAAQYGSNFDKALEKLAKKAKAKGKEDYLQRFSQRPAIAALSSGGKDSCLALWLMQKQGFEVKCLVSIIPDNPDSFMYHQPNLEILMLQSKALGIPLLFERSRGEKEKELADLKRALLEAKTQFGANAIVSGALYSNYQKKRIEEICKELKLRVFLPLWHMDQAKELEMLVDKGFIFIFSKIAGLGLSEKWLGGQIGQREILELKKLGKKVGLNLAGEGGEFESLVLDAPNFKKRIQILQAKKNMQNKFTGSLEIGEAVLEDKV